jgi:hypothetical protein
MAQSLLMIFFTLALAHADIFDFGDKGGHPSKISPLVEKLRALEVKDGPEYEERFNQLVKAIENSIEEEKLFCSGEVADDRGKTLPAAQKQLCMRELKKNYVEAADTIFEMKKKYLGLIHQRQLQKLSEIQKNLKTDIEKNF